jgi:hypothetical protein
VELTENSQPAARRELPPRRGLQQMVAERGLTLPEGSLADVLDRERRPLQPGERPLSAILAELRASER